MKQQPGERVGQIGIADGLDEGSGQPRRRHRVEAWRDAQHRGQGTEAIIHLLQQRLVALIEDLAQPLAGEMKMQPPFVDQAQCSGVRAQRTTEVVEAPFDLLAEPHHVARAMLAQHQQRRLVVERFDTRRRRLQGLLDRPVQAARQRAELLDGKSFDVLEHTHRIGAGDVFYAERVD